ncbi:Uncharacterized protein APZ42_017936 [Daphnia magna]|uniref:Uncharacterized protein n=2 Tax=Daphnia magna TaxID=35525 RepID=A0ABQ9ZRR6_9CRUS|nr:hypothetical protein OUZ56_030452 [Daphnia magna]KZS16301.1 Uncharacterized protein APZ42_017936 [Daphnia magna]
MQTEMDNNENHVIQGLEALLKGEEVQEVCHSKSFEEMRTRFRDSFSLDQSKDSGFTFSNLSFRHTPSVNTSIQNQSMESGFSCELYDTSFSFKPAVNVSFDGCYIEDDFVPVTRGLAQKLQQSQWPARPKTGILSSAVSHGGDIKSKTPSSPSSIQEAYTQVKYTYLMRKCWNSICCIRKLHTQLTQKTMDLEQPIEWNVICLLDAFKNEIIEMTKEFSDSKLASLLHEIQNSLELVYRNIGYSAMDWNVLKQLQRLSSNLFVALYCQCVLQNSLSTPAEEKFRSEKRFTIWNSLV